MLTYSRVNIIALVKSMPVNHIKAAVIAPSSILILYWWKIKGRKNFIRCIDNGSLVRFVTRTVQPSLPSPWKAVLISLHDARYNYMTNESEFFKLECEVDRIISLRSNTYHCFRAYDKTSYTICITIYIMYISAYTRFL